MNKENKLSFSKASFKKTFDDYFASLVSFAHTFIQDLDKSEDIVQDVFVRLWEKREAYEVENIKSYLFRSVRNRCLNYLRDQKVIETNKHEIGNFIESEDFFLNQVLNEEYIRLLHQAIDTLPTKRQQIVKYNLMGLKNAEIADLMGVSVNTIRSQKLYIYRELRKKMTKHAYSFFIMMFLN